VQRLPDGSWSAPAYVSLGGASYGFQIGAQSTDLVLVFTGDNGLRALIDDHVKLGADLSITAGPVGRNVEVGTNLTMDSAIYSYSRSEGLFAGVSLDGAVLEFDEDKNRDAYGEAVTPDRLLSGDVDPAPAVEPFVRMVEAIDLT
jgi:lipid-binding SYLF domain-containing protein